MLPEVVGSTIRTVLAAVAGGLVTNGYLDDSTLNALIGGIVAAVTLGWSIYQKKKAKDAAK